MNISFADIVWIDKGQILMLGVLGILIVLDVLSGLMKAFKNKCFKSSKMRDGLFRKLSYFIVLGVALLLDDTGEVLNLGFDIPIFAPAAIYIVFMEVTSILENAVAIEPRLGGNRLLGLFMSKNSEQIDEAG